MSAASRYAAAVASRRSKKRALCRRSAMCWRGGSASAARWRPPARVAPPTSRRVANASHAARQAGQARMCSMRPPRSAPATSPSSAAESASSASSHAGARRGSDFRRRTSASGARTERRTLSPFGHAAGAFDRALARGAAGEVLGQLGREGAGEGRVEMVAEGVAAVHDSAPAGATRMRGVICKRHHRRELAPRPVQTGLDRPDRQRQLLGELLVAPVGEIAEHDQLGELLGQALERRLRELEPLVPDGAGVRILAARQRLEELGIHPGRLALLAGAAVGVHEEVAGDAVRPGAERRDVRRRSGGGSARA